MSGALGAGVSAVGLDVGLIAERWGGEPDAVERHARDLASGLSARGHRVHVLCLDDDPSARPWAVRTERVDGVDVRRMMPAREPATLRDLVADQRADDVVLAWLAETPCDVVHVQHLRGFGAGALRAISDMGRPLLVSLHDAWLLCPCAKPEHALDDPAARLACARSRWPELLPGSGEGEAVEARLAFAIDALALPHRLLVPGATEAERYASCGVPRDRMAVLSDLTAAVSAARGVEALTLVHERLYVELARDVTGHVPQLLHPVEGLVEPPPAADPAPARKRGLLGRLFGR